MRLLQGACISIEVVAALVWECDETGFCHIMVFLYVTIKKNYPHCAFQFLPQIGARIIATAAADAKVQIHTVETQETSQVYKCHIGRVKRLATAPDTPYMLWSASEDGTIR